MTRHKYLVLCEPIKWVLHTVHRLVVSMKLSVCVCVWRKLLIFHILCQRTPQHFGISSVHACHAVATSLYNSC